MIEELEDKTMGYLNDTIQDMIYYLHKTGGAVKTLDKKTMMEEWDCPLNPSEYPLEFFNCIYKAIKDLDKATISSVSYGNCVIIAFKICGGHDN